MRKETKIPGANPGQSDKAAGSQEIQVIRESHYAHAQELVESWPEWKKEVFGISKDSNAYKSLNRMRC